MCRYSKNSTGKSSNNSTATQQLKTVLFENTAFTSLQQQQQLITMDAVSDTSSFNIEDANVAGDGGGGRIAIGERNDNNNDEYQNLQRVRILVNDISLYESSWNRALRLESYPRNSK